jgi:hypothetical protein
MSIRTRNYLFYTAVFVLLSLAGFWYVSYHTEILNHRSGIGCEEER